MPVEVVREPVKKKFSILKHIKTLWSCFKVFKIKRKSFVFLSWNTSKSFGFVLKFLDQMEKFRFCFKNSGTHQNVFVLFKSF